MVKKLTVTLITIIAALTMLISSINDERIVLCSLGNNIAIFNARSCLLYIEKFELSDEYITKINTKLGIMTILSSNHDNKFKVASELLRQGVNINSINNSDGLGLPPLHSAVLLDDIESFNFLIKKGANINSRHVQTNESLYIFTEKLLKKRPTQNRNQIIEILKRMS